MAREVLVGIVVAAKDFASGVLGKIQGAGKATDKGVAGLASGMQKSFKMMGAAAVGLNQGLELLKKGVHLVQATIGQAVVKSLEYRAANDAGRKEVESFGRSLDQMHGRLGDQLMPLITGVTSSMKPMLAQFEKWLKANEKLIQTRIIEWAERLAKGLVSGVAFAVSTVVKAWHGWQMIIETVTAVANKGFALVLDGATSVLEGMEKIAEWSGATDVAKSIGEVRATLSLMSKDADAIGDEALARAAREVNAMDENVAAINRVRDAFHEGIGKIAVNALKKVDVAVQHSSQYEHDLAAAWRARLNETRNYALAARSALQSMTDDQLEYQVALDKKRQEDFERWKEYQMQRVDANRAANEEMLASVQGWAGQAFDAFRSAFGQVGDIINGEVYTALDAMGDAITSIGKMILDEAAKFAIAKGIEMLWTKIAASASIQAHAAQAAAAAFASISAIPIIGPGLAPAAAAQAYAATLAFEGGLAFAEGGLVPGRKGQAQPATVHGGELIIPEPMVTSLLEGRSAPQGGSRAAPAGGPSGGGVTLQLGTLGLPGRAEAARWIRDVFAPVWRDGQKNGWW